ncbi:MAG: hypothetical protein M1813_001723 [Trichoglossum hirsutum]|nr:MAG: hypothetical protein M1813_001723 [Trichoglossum hirsutum]
MKNPFANFTIAITGEFGAAKPADIQRWVEAAGGAFASKVDKKVTHLVSSWKDYKARVAKVKEALKNSDIHIVSYDWLEDSLQKRRPRKERGAYLMKNVEKQKRKEEKLIMRGIKKVDKKISKIEKKSEKRRKQSIEEFALEMGSNTHHIYKDHTGFEYNVCLARVVDIHSNKNDFFHLKIYESNAIPHLYASIARYRRPGAQGVEVLSPIGSFYDQAFLTFRKSFERRTGRSWEDRLDAVAEHGEKEVVEGKYFYRPPLGRKKPKGVLPDNKVVVTTEMLNNVIRKEVEEVKEDEGLGGEEREEEEDTGDSDDDDDEDEAESSTNAAPPPSNAFTMRFKQSLIF